MPKSITQNIESALTGHYTVQDGKHRPVVVCGKVAYVHLANRQQAMIDAEFAEAVSHHNWTVLNAYYNGQRAHGTYARTYIDGKTILLHRFLIELVGVNAEMIDHQNHNGLDNRLSNLRPTTNRGNQMNRYDRRDRFDTLPAIIQRLTSNGRIRYCVQPRIDGQKTTLGTCDSLLEAGLLYMSILEDESEQMIYAKLLLERTGYDFYAHENDSKAS